MSTPQALDSRLEDHLQKMDAKTRSLLEPFFAQPSQDEWVRAVLSAYFHYFLTISEADQAKPAPNKVLHAALKHLVPAGKRQSLDQIEEYLSDEFRRKGYFFLGGMTGPHYGPYIWKRTEKRVFDVELPDRHESVSVFFMHDFLMLSWMHFQTFGRQGTGGWAKWGEPPWEDGLYCVAAAYEIEQLDATPVFQVSLLKHEAQHLADKQDYPALSAASLEYRAKLVELIYFDEMKYRLRFIVQEASPTHADPHRYAAYAIVQNLSKKIFGKPGLTDETIWISVPYEKIQAAARELLGEHTRKLENSSHKGKVKLIS